MEPWLLDTQYRMHPAIAELPNMLFYDGRIRTGIKAEQRPTPAGPRSLLHITFLVIYVLARMAM